MPDFATVSPPDWRNRSLPKIMSTLARRLGLGVLTLFIVSVVIAFLVSMLPGDFARAVLGQSATPETVAAFQREIGIGQPPVQRYLVWFGGILHGDFGNSFTSAGEHKRTVAGIIAPRLWNTLFLAGFTAAIAVPIAIGLGILTATLRNSTFDRAVNGISLTAISFPEFFMAYVLLLVFSNQLQWLPALSTVDAQTTFTERLWRCSLPAMTLALAVIAHMMRMTRAAIIGVLDETYVEMARFKGIRPGRIVLRHALRNALAPIASVVAFNLAYLIVGVVVVEVVFAYPGIGQLMVDAVSTRDIPVIQACALIFATIYILLNLAADVIAILSNPRLLHP